MNKGMLALGIILLAIFAFTMINVVNSYFSGNEMDYYLLKETTEASMKDAVDLGYYKMSGQVRMDKEKFAESFIRRFAASVRLNRDYNIKFYDLNETPPKVTVRITSKTTASNSNGETAGMTNEISAILETTYKSNKLIEQLIQQGKLNYSKLNQNT